MLLMSTRKIHAVIPLKDKTLIGFKRALAMMAGIGFAARNKVSLAF